MGGTPDLNNRETRGVKDGIELLHIHRDPHPRMDATLEVMLSFREAGDVHAAALKDSRPRNLNARKPAGAFRSRSRRGSIQLADEAAAKLFHFGEGVRLAALVGHVEHGSFRHLQLIGLEVPIGIGMAGLGLRKQPRQRRKRSQTYVLAEVSAEGRIEACGFALMICAMGAAVCWARANIATPMINTNSMNFLAFILTFPFLQLFDWNWER
jgi:hypothetical protein